MIDYFFFNLNYIHCIERDINLMFLDVTDFYKALKILEKRAHNGNKLFSIFVEMTTAFFKR